MVRLGRPPRIEKDSVAGYRVVRKYGNRRLYDTVASCYINREQLLKLADNFKLKILDAKTGEDLTWRELAEAMFAVVDWSDWVAFRSLQNLYKRNVR